MSALALQSMPDPQVFARARRRTFTMEEKLRIIKEADACSKNVELGTFIRK